MKPCYECNVTKTLDEFYSHPQSLDGRAGLCKACHRERMRVRRLLNPAVQAYDRERYQRPERRLWAAEESRRWRAEHPDAYRAQTAVSNAVRDGRLKKEPCSLCGATTNIHGHHRDYAKPLEVVWLCAKCHHRLHATFPELGGHFEASP